MARLIQPVNDNYDKQNTYRYNIRRFNKAMQEGFFLEALLIDYAMIEDRLRSFIYHIGLLNTRDSARVDGKEARDSVRDIIRRYKRGDEDDLFLMKAIAGKMKIIRCTLLWADEENLDLDNKYLRTLRKQYDQYVDVDGLLKILEEIEQWCKYRNEIIHGLLNKNEERLNDTVMSQAEKGMELARYVDSQVKNVKKGNKIRRSVKLQSR